MASEKLKVSKVVSTFRRQSYIPTRTGSTECRVRTRVLILVSSTWIHNAVQYEHAQNFFKCHLVQKKEASGFTVLVVRNIPVAILRKGCVTQSGRLRPLEFLRMCTISIEIVEANDPQFLTTC